MKKFKTYRYDHGQIVDYSSRSKKGSYANYEDLKAALYRRYGRYSYIKSYADYKKELSYIYIYY